MGYVQQARENHVKKKVEEALRSKMKAKALMECDHYTSKYAQCATGRTLSVVWQCRCGFVEIQHNGNKALHLHFHITILSKWMVDNGVKTVVSYLKEILIQ
uniref:COX assembly mitochondrial protein n=1 Tax=Tarenaya spinosa TaxID=228870 RepID=Q1KUM8_9ROSI|nr:hypothetical protein [Tarenaya spinosa]